MIRRTKPITLVCVGGPVHEESYVVSPDTQTITVPRLDLSSPAAVAAGELRYTEHVYRVSALNTPGGRTPTRLYLRYAGATLCDDCKAKHE